MNPPEIATEGRDKGNNITFRVLAYRRLTDNEALRVIAKFLISYAGRKLQNETVTIQTVIGLDARMQNFHWQAGRVIRARRRGKGPAGQHRKSCICQG
jgi:hypothetical protein